MSNSKWFRAFKGQFVYILTRSLRSTVDKQTGSVVIEGFLFDECEDCFYLTPAPNSTDIVDSVKKAEVVRMFIPPPEMLESMMPHSMKDEDLN